nr:VanZ family protein [Nesterenkonia massiliensis]
MTTTAVGFGLTLLIETTQLTGVWRIYRSSYWLFDVDNLLANTAGALLGAVLAGLLSALRRRIYPDRPQSVSPRIIVARRLTGMVCDGLAMLLPGTAMAVAVASNAWQLYVLSRDAAELDQNLTQQLGLWAPLVVIAILTVTTGRTVGDHAVRLHFSGTWTGSGRRCYTRCGYWPA